MNLNADQIKNGWWFFRRNEAFPPPAITDPAGYTDEDHLNLVITQLEISDYHQRKLVAEWCHILPSLTNIRYLWFNSRTSQAMFEAACRLPNLEGLFVKWGGIQDLQPLHQPPSLRYLHLGGSGAIKDIETLSNLQQLIVLELENFNAIRQLDPLSSLTELEGLAVEGSMWTPHMVDTLAPLSHLTNLRYLFLANLKALDGTLIPLASLKNLVHLRTSLRWPKAEFATLRNEMPALCQGSPFELEWIEKFGK